MADGSLIFDTKIDSKGFTQGLNKLKSGAKSGGLGVAKSLAGALAGLGLAITTTAVAGAKKVMDASISFESAFAGVKKTVDATEEEFSNLRTSILETSKSLKVVNPNELAEVMAIAGQLGIETKNLEKFSETVVKMGTATNLSREEAAVAMARLANITGTSQENFDRLGSTIVSLGNNFATTESEITEMALRLAGTGSLVKMSESDILAFSAAMSSVGINAEAGGSSMSRVWSKINTEVLSSGKHLEGFASLAGMSASEFSQAWQSAPAEAMTKVVEGLDRVKQSGGDVNATLKALGISSVVEIDTLARLSGAHSELAKAVGLAGEAWAKNTALDNEFIARLQTSEEIINGLKNSVTVLAIQMGDALKPAFHEALVEVNGFMAKLEKGFNSGGFTGFASALGEIIPEAINSFTEKLPDIMALGVSFIDALGQGLEANAGNIGANVGKATDTLLTGILNSAPNWFGAGLELITGFVNGVAENASSLVPNILTSIIGIADKIIEGLPAFIDAGLNLLKGLAQGIADGLPTFIENAPRIINEFFSAIYSKIPDFLKAGLEIIITLGKGLIQAIPTLIANIPAIIMAIVNVFTGFNFVALGKSLILKIGSGMRSLLSTIVGIAKSIGQGIINAIKSFFGEGVSTGHLFISKVANGIRNAIGFIRSGVESVMQAAFSVLRSAVGRVISIGGDIVRGIASGIRNAGGAVLEALGGVVDSAISWVKGKLGIKSPSRVFRDQVGKMIGAGLAIGIDKSKAVVVESSKALSQASLVGFRPTLKAFSALGALNGSLFAKNLESNKANVIRSANNTGLALFRAMAKQMKGVESTEKEAFLERAEKMHKLKIAHIGVAYKEYQNIIVGEEKKITERIDKLKKEAEMVSAQASQTKNKALKASLNAQSKGLKNQQTLLKQQLEDLKTFEKRFTSTFDKMVDDYEKAVDEVTKKSESMAEKLVSYGEIVKEIKEDLGDGVTRSHFELTEISEQIDQLKRYGEVLSKVQARGADSDVTKKLEGLGIDEAIRYGELLLAQSDKDWRTYMSKMAEKRSLAEKISKDIYAKDLQTLDRDFTQKAIKNLQTIEKGAADMGVQSAKALTDGFKKKAHEFERAVSSTIANAMMKASEELGVNLFSNSRGQRGNTTITNNSNVHIGKVVTSETADAVRKTDEKLASYNRKKLRGAMS